MVWSRWSIIISDRRRGCDSDRHSDFTQAEGHVDSEGGPPVPARAAHWQCIQVIKLFRSKKLERPSLSRVTSRRRVRRSPSRSHRGLPVR
jgi:hypothetical protein